MNTENNNKNIDNTLKKDCEIKKKPKKRFWARQWSKIRIAFKFPKKMIGKIKGSPHQIALGIALGSFIAFTPTIGAQMMIGVFIAWIVGANKLAAMLPAWYTNPITIPPVFYFNYRIGQYLTGNDLIGYERFKDAMLFFGEEFFAREGWINLLEVLKDGFVDLWIGSLIVASIIGPAHYPVVYYMVASVRKIQMRRIEKQKIARQKKIQTAKQSRTRQHLKQQNPEQLNQEQPNNEQ